ncbi:acyl transferase domain-containing protein, partial [Baffinella frigidus]
VTWEALENAGVPTDAARGSNTGVFIGGFMLDHHTVHSHPENQKMATAQSAAGCTATSLSSRISYTFDLRGPCMTVDTACSSSLVAVDLACKAIANGSCEAAIAGGVNVMLSPSSTLLMCKGGFLSPDGRCKAFDGSADGYGRGEGAAVVYLKRLDRAVEDGDRIFATVLASGVNQDGKTDGMATPSATAQIALAKNVLSRAGIDSSHVGYVEAHGTGTRVGDPLEAAAIGAVYGGAEGRQGPVLIGSIKTNISHLEAAAGIVGFIKAALILHTGVIFPQRSFTSLNRAIPFGEHNVEVCVNATPLPSDAPFVAVNSFGYGGTNAHAILAKFDAGARAAQGGEETTQLLPLCAMSQASLSSMSTLLADFLERNPETPLREIGQTLARGRSHFPERLVVAASDRAGAITALRDHAKGATHAALAKGSATAGKSLFVYNGMGPQWWRMGRELLESEPVFRAAAETIDAYFVAVARWSILAEIVKDEDASRISESWVAQPANFVIQAALTELLRHRGLRPDGYLGHSVGEISAAWAAGCLTLEEATHAVYHRSHVMRGLKGGAMLAVAVSAARAESMVLPGSNVSIASYNAPNSVVLSGDRAALEPIASRLKAEGVFARFLEVQLAYHSSAVDPMETAALESLAFLAPKTPTSVIFSTMTGSRVDRAVHDAEYWWRNIRSSVKFHQAVEAAVEQGFSTFIEVGPHPVLGPSIQEILTSMKEPGRTLFSLKRHTPEQHSINSVVSQAFCCGTKLDWGGSRSFVDLPHYPFQRQRLWKESAASSDARVGPYAHGHPGRTSSGHPGRTSSSISSGSLGGHPLLGVRESSPGHSWLTSLPNMPLAFFRDHQIQGVVVFPAAGYIEAALAAAAAARVSVYHGSSKNLNDLQDASGQVLALKNLEFQSVLAIQQKQATRIRVRLTEDSTFSLHGQAGDAPWTQYAVGRVLAMATFRTPPSLDLAEAFEELERNAVPGDDLYQALAARWMEYGPQFQAVKRLARHAGGVVAELELHASAPGGFLVHPSLVDGAFQSLTYLVSESQAHLVGTLVPVRIASVRLFRALESRVMVVCNGGLCKDGTLQGDVTVTDASGAVLLTMKGVVLSPVGGNADEGATSQLEYAFEWEELEWEDTPEPEMPEADSSAFKFRVLEGVETLPWLSAHHSDEATHLVWVAPASDSDTFGLDATERLLEILRGPLDECRLTVLTRGAHAISRGETCNPAHTGLWSFVRVLMTERPELSVRLIDLPREVDGLDVEMTSAAIFAADNQEETAVRASSQFARKLVRADKGDSDRQLERETVRAQSGPYEVFVPRPGILDSLCFRPRVLGDPGPLDVEVEVHCCSLNFKDVMKALGMLNATVLNNTYLGNGIGMEASGRVLRVGAQVADLKMGDDVHCHVGGAMATRLTMDHRWVVKKASCSSFAEASCYFVYTTAWHSLVNVARLQRGERVLIHSAAGGVGQAAIQVAQMIGAEVYATAGTAEKRKELSDAGILHVYDSRTLDFADDIRRDTKGEGVNVVLNSLAGEALHESFELLCTGGRFVELGKKDIAGSAALNMLPFNKSITFSAVDLDRIGLDSAVYRPLALSVVAAVEAGDLVPMKMHHFAGDRVVDAFRLMASGSMTGKAVVHLSEGTLEVAPGFASNKVFRADRSYLVTGGLGGFGLQTAAFLVGQGARHLVLVSRRGAPADADRHVIDGMQGLGASVHVRAVDVSDRDAVARLLDEIRRDLPPLAGVFHAAAILDDGPIADITPQNLARVVAPKAIGAWILHELTQDTPLDHFVGNSFQGAYCLANGFINGLAAVRRAMGLPAKAVSGVCHSFLTKARGAS